MPDPSLFRACDRCYRLKERCPRESNDQGCCARCSRLGHPCTILRNVRPRGRRSHARLLFTSNELIWCNQMSYPPLAMKGIKNHESSSSLYPRHSELSVTLSCSAKTTVVQNMPRSGLHSRSAAPESSRLDISKRVFSPAPAVSVSERSLSVQSLLPDEVLLESMCSVDHFLNYFMLGRNFSRYFQSLGRKRFMESPDLIREGALACAGVVFRARSRKSGFDDINFARSAISLRKLRSAKVTITDVGAFLTLGLILTTFDIITSGTFAHAITRFTLSLVQPLYPLICWDPGLDSETLCLISMDTIQSLLRGQIPVIRYRVRDPNLVDRLAGLCGPLLPLMYDICQFAYQSDTPSPSSGRRSNTDSFNYLDTLVQSWQPLPPPDILNKFSAQEVNCLLSHARMFQSAVRLVLHRLRYPFGTEDGIATGLSTEILSESLAYSIMVGEENKLPQTLFPWMVAAFEVRSPEDRNMLMRKELPKSREILGLPAAKMKDCIRFVWKMRDSGCTSFLFELLEEAPTYVIPI